MQALSLQESRDMIRCTLNGTLGEEIPGRALLEMPGSSHHGASGARALSYIYNS